VNITPEQLEAYLDILLDKDVEEFECSDFHVRFAATEEAMEAQPVIAGEKKEAPQSMWHHHALWPGGKPPSFEE
jgi:hypothetical protein